jgi:hypothetical protein
MTRKSIFQRSINKTCSSSEDKFITVKYNGESVTIYMKALFTSFVYRRARKCKRKIRIGWE